MKARPTKLNMAMTLALAGISLLVSSCSLTQSPAPVYDGTQGGYQGGGYYGGYNQGYGQNAYNQGGYNQGGYNQGYNQGSYDQGGYNQAQSYNGGAYAPVNSASATNGYYTVQRGDNLYRIALRFNVSKQDLARWNNLANMDEIREGQRLRVVAPAGGSNVSTYNPPEYEDGRNNTSIKDDLSNANKEVVTISKVSRAGYSWPCKGCIVKGYGSKASLKNIVLSGKNDKNVYSIGDGIVRYNDNIKVLGRTVLINHMNHTSGYANINPIVKVNQRVKRGQKIGTINDGGPMPGKFTLILTPHDDVETFLNPLDYLPKR